MQFTLPYPPVRRVTSRSGITLMEVLIAIGILSIGLTSVVAILPAGRKQAAKAIIYDRASLLAANALADAVTSGVCHQHALDMSNANVVLDPLGPWPSSMGLPTPLPTAGTLRRRGVFAAAMDTAIAPAALGLLFRQARDDLEITAAANQDDPPLYLAIDGARAFTGRFSSAILRLSVDGSPVAAGDLVRLSAVVFHNREPISSAAFTPASLQIGHLVVTIPTGRVIGDTVRSGTVFYFAGEDADADGVLDAGEDLNGYARLDGPSLHQVLSAAPADSTSFFITHTGQDRGAGPSSVAILLDSVGLAERIATIEGSEEYAR
ncbi:MAG: hypothetical protein ACKOCN_02035 [Planctomycetaceae bacterium]